MTIPRTVRSWQPLLGVALLLASCDFPFFSDEEPPPELARVVINGTSPVLLELLTSTAFQPVTDPETGTTSISFVAATIDTIDVPFENEYALAPNDRFYVRLTNPDTATASVQMQVFFDGVKMYDNTRDLEDGSMEFSWIYF
ncbi:MAG: hypothetical protein ACRELD_07545 [Longimicrobiales bacterium]